MRCPKALIVAVLVLAAGGFIPADAGVECSDAQYRVMSFNMRYGTASDGENAWENRRELLLDTITTFAPDLLGVQECLSEQAEFLRTRLDGYGFVGAGRDDGDAAGEMCAIFFREDMFMKLDEGHFWLSETPDVIASKSWDSALTRMVSWVGLRSRVDSLVTFYFLNTHFDHVGEVARVRSGVLIRERAAMIAGGIPVILAGDFNAPADPAVDGPYRELTSVGEEPRFVDTYRALHAVGGSEGTFSAFAGRLDGPRIDWIVVSPFFETLESSIVRTHDGRRYPSDHFPVTAIIKPRRLDGGRATQGAPE